jgi:hypothetical protein
MYASAVIALTGPALSPTASGGRSDAPTLASAVVCAWTRAPVAVLDLDQSGDTETVEKTARAAALIWINANPGNAGPKQVHQERA